jgi:hypothetical protein
MNLFDDKFTFGLTLGKDLITDAAALLPEFEEHTQKIFNELFDPTQPFDQTGDTENCKICAYRQLCYR